MRALLWIIFILVALIAVVYLMGTAVWMTAAVIGIELGSLASISVAGILVIAGLLAGTLLLRRKLLNRPS